MNNCGRLTIISILLISLTLLLTMVNVQAQDDDSISTPNPVVLQQLDRVESQIRNIRQLNPQRPIVRQVLEPNRLEERVQSDILASYTPEDVQRDLDFYVAFGFMEPGANLLGMTANLLTGQITGYYDHQRDTIYLVSGDSLTPFNRILYARHYLQFLQHHNFAPAVALTKELIEQNPDQAMAMRALFEGDAQLVTAQYIQQLIANEPELVDLLLGHAIETSNPTLDGVPPILSRELLFPSQEGLAFVQSLYEETNSWRLVNYVYERPPLSTEHILHPPLYLLYEEPHQITLPSFGEPLNDFAGAPEWTLVRDQALGEFYLREHLGTVLDPAQAEIAAAGWGGDRFQLFARDFDDALALVWKLSWDSPFDAREFNSIYGSFLGQQIGVSGAIIDNTYSCWIGGERSVCKAELQDGDILVIMTPSGEMAQHLMNWYINRSVQIFG